MKTSQHTHSPTRAFSVNEEAAETIQKLIMELDSAVPKDGAQVQFLEYGGGPEECKIIATQQGYLRLGVEFLRGALAPHSDRAPKDIAVDLDYLISQDSDIEFCGFERVDCLPPRPTPPTGASGRSTALLVVGCIGLFVCMAVLLIVGLVTTIQWLFHS